MNEQKSGCHEARHGLEQLARLELALQDGGKKSLPPVELWNPPYCGDIGMAIARDGSWYYQGSRINRIALVKLFSTVLRRDDDGRHYLVTPVEKVDVAVEDAPFLGVEMEMIAGEGDYAGEQVLVVRTNLDDVVRVGAEHPIRFETQVDGGFKPYVHVRGGLEALFTRALAYDLAELLVNDDQDRTGIWSGGRFFAVAGT